MEEGQAMGAKDFFIGGDITSSSSLRPAVSILRSLTVLTGMASTALSFVGCNC